MSMSSVTALFPSKSMAQIKRDMMMRKARQAGSPMTKTFLFRILRSRKGRPHRSRIATRVPVFLTTGRSRKKPERLIYIR